MKSESEELSRSAFNAFLIERDNQGFPDWTDVPQYKEPPDYLLRHQGTIFAVEVTILMDKLPIKNGEISLAAVIGSFNSFVSEVQRRAENENILRGTYVIHFPRQVQDLKSAKEDTKMSLLDYIRNTQQDRSSPVLKVHFCGREVCGIEKLSEPDNEIVRSGPFLAKFEDESATDIQRLVQERIDEKTKLLTKVSLPKILLLHDRYGFANRSQFIGCRSRLIAAETFYTIFIVEGNNGFVLCSQNPKWIE